MRHSQLPDPTWRRRSSSSVISRSSTLSLGVCTSYGVPTRRQSSRTRNEYGSRSVTVMAACPHVGLVFLEYGVNPLVLMILFTERTREKKGRLIAHVPRRIFATRTRQQFQATHHTKQTNKALDQTLLLPPFSVRSNCQSTIIAQRFARTRNRRWQAADTS